MSQEKIDKLRKSLDGLINKTGNVLFFVPNISTPSSSVYEIYFHAHVMKGIGYNVKILTDDEFTIPTWIESSLTNIKHESIEKVRLSVTPEDIVVIPEIHTNIMEQTRNLPCIRIALIQSIDYLLTALVNGTELSEFGIDNIITISNDVKKIINDNFVRTQYNIEKYDIGLPEYFKKNNKLKKPVISIIGRNQNELSKVIKLFYLKFPHFSWITFDPMITNAVSPQQLDRKAFAERLSENFASIWVDRISSFGTFPLECMRVGNIPIGLIPDIAPEYLFDVIDGKKHFNLDSGFWCDNIYELPSLIGDAISLFLDDSFDSEYYLKMANIAEKYTQENSKEQLIKIYDKFVSDRVKIIESAIQTLENKNKEVKE